MDMYIIWLTCTRFMHRVQHPGVWWRDCNGAFLWFSEGLGIIAIVTLFLVTFQSWSTFSRQNDFAAVVPCHCYIHHQLARTRLKYALLGIFVPEERPLNGNGKVVPKAYIPWSFRWLHKYLRNSTAHNSWGNELSQMSVMSVRFQHSSLLQCICMILKCKM